MRKSLKYLVLIIVVFIVTAVLLKSFVLEGRISIDNVTEAGRKVVIYPDYSQTVIPPNIAPLNFVVKEKGEIYYVKIYSKRERPIEIFSRSSTIIIPEKSWHKLLDSNRNEQLYFDIFIKTEKGNWISFSTITNKVAVKDIDSFVVYRKMYPTYLHRRSEIGIYQRDMSGYKESCVLSNRDFRGTCVNCHSFALNNPNKMVLGVRSTKFGTSTLLLEDKKISKIGAKFGYTCWHPTGKSVTFSINGLPMFFHSARNEVRDTLDVNSLLAYYLLNSNEIKTSPEISDKKLLETWPAWSPDGKYLYFCSTKALWSRGESAVDYYDKIKYDLMRIKYDIEKDSWGKPKVVISSKETGFSIAMPHISPDGRWLSFCMCDYGFFPTWQESSDLYIVDLKEAEETGKFKYRRLEINSDRSESWHSWSSNSRWIVFSSKRDYGVFTKPYFSYVDENGKFYKPILMPQKDPLFYDQCLHTYNTTEFVTGPIKLTNRQFSQMVRNPSQINAKLPITMATPKAGGLPSHTEPWQQRE